MVELSTMWGSVTSRMRDLDPKSRSTRLNSKTYATCLTLTELNVKGDAHYITFGLNSSFYEI